MSVTLEEAIYQKYIVPTEREAHDYVGVELEYPLVNLSRRPVDIPAVQKVTEAFGERFGFTKQIRDDNGNLYSLTHPPTGDNLSFDCSFNTLELSFGKERSLFVLNKRFLSYIGFLQEELRRIGHLLTGMGIHPYHKYNLYEPIANDRYRMLFHHLSSYRQYPGFFHELPQFGMMAAASQVQVDVEKDHIIQTLRVMNRLEPYKALLFANSFYEGLPDLAISRDYLWRYSMQGYPPHNLGMFEAEPETLDEYIRYVAGQSIYCTGKHGKYFHFAPTPLYEYMQRESITGMYFADGSWRTAAFRPEITDLEHHRTFKFEDLTYRGTIEFRSACEQPISEAFTLAAFHAGLARRLDALEELLESDRVLYHQGFTASELRELLTHRRIPALFDQKQISAQLLRILELAREGLAERALGEESFLAPLFERAERLTNPAGEFLAGLEAGDPLPLWIERYAAAERSTS